MNIVKEIINRIKFWEDIGDYIYKQQLKIEDLEKSRNNWKKKYKELKCKS